MCDGLSELQNEALDRTLCFQLVPRGRGKHLGGGHDDGPEELQGENWALNIVCP